MQIEPNKKHCTPHFYPQSFSMLCKIASNYGLATNGVGCPMPSLHPYPRLRHPPTTLEQRLSIIHLGPNTIQMTPLYGIGAIFPNLMRQPQSIIKCDTFIIWIQTFGNVAELNLNSNKNNKYEIEVPNARGKVNNLDYHVYHYPRRARPLCLENPILFC